MSDGSRLRESWTLALNEAQAQLRSLLAASSSPTWRRIPPTTTNRDSLSVATTIGGSTHTKGKMKALPHVSDVIAHRRSTKSGEVLRLVLDVPQEGGFDCLEAWKAVLTTPEMRKEWDPTVEGAHIIEMFDPDTRIQKTDFTLGWPVNPRDAITISRTFTDASTLVDISTSLPRSNDEPAYLRPAPPYVRSHVHLFAWCIQAMPATPDPSGKTTLGPSKMRITCLWQHDLKAVWGASSLSQNLPSMMIGLVHAVRKRGDRVPLLAGWGKGVLLDNVAFASGREALRVDYSIIHETEEPEATKSSSLESSLDLRTLKERRRLERSVEVIVPLSQGWEIQISTRASSEDTANLPWTVHATRIAPFSPTYARTDPEVGSFSPSGTSPLPLVPQSSIELVALRVVHALPTEHAVLKVKLNIELANAAKGLRVNGSPHSIQDSESRDPTSFTLPKQMLQDAASVGGLSFQTASTSGSNQSGPSTAQKPPFTRTNSDRTPGAEKAILTLTRRNYIYFTSLLQEPEAKWRPVTESRGVTITQLDSIDPTLVVYRAEAVFVGVGLWDLLSTIKTPGARIYWDKSHDDATLLEDVNELTELWHHTTKAAWPVNARDTVVLTTEYKSPTSAHVFSFSTDDRQLFQSIPEPEPATIRTQVDLRGWAIEALSPNTTLLTLLDQSDPKGWSNKSSIPQQMIATLAGVGEFAIKNGGPPVATRLGGAKLISQKYDHDKGSYKLTYGGAEKRREKQPGLFGTSDSTPAASTTDLSLPTEDSKPRPSLVTPSPAMPRIECQIRCDVDTWSSSIWLVIDPPPQGVSCLKRHRLSSGGGGLWITIEHDAVFVGDERLHVSVRKGNSTGSKDKTVVLVNGTKVKVDVEDLPESEAKALSKQKRAKPARIPLDQPPVLGVIRRRKVEWDSEEAEAEINGSGSSDGASTREGGAIAPSILNPFTNFISAAMEQTISTTNAAAAVFTPATYANPVSITSPMDSPKPPLHGALDALSYLIGYHAKPSSEGWTRASDKGGLPVLKKIEPAFSSTIAIHRAEKVIPGISAGEISLAITNVDNRRSWDNRFVSYMPLEVYGNGASEMFISTNSGFPFRDRGFWVSTVVARLVPPSSVDSRQGRTLEVELTSPSPSHGSAIFIASSSFHPSAASTAFSASKINPTVLPIGDLIISGWILETIDPYMPDQNYPIPSTRCTHFVAVDYRGSVPVAFNTSMNAMLPRTEILGLEAWLKTKGGFAVGPSVRFPASGLGIQNEAENVTDNTKKSTMDLGWALFPPLENLHLLTTTLEQNAKTFNTRILIAPSPAITRPTADSSETLVQSNQTTPQPTRLVSQASISPPRRATSPAGMADRSPFATNAPISSVRDRRLSATITRSPSSTHRRRPSSPARAAAQALARRANGRSTSSSSADSESDYQGPVTDMIVAEIVVDPTLYPNGYKILMASAARDYGNLPQEGTLLLPLTLTPPIQPLDLSASSTDTNAVQLPLAAEVYTIPASPLLSTPTDKPVVRHLLRVSLPSAQYHAPAIQDPLTGETRNPPPKPPWLTELELKGADVNISLLHVPTKPSGNSPDVFQKVNINGSEVSVVSEKRSVSSLGRDLLEDDKLWAYPILRRVDVPRGSGQLPARLTEPIAVALNVVEDPKPSSTPAPIYGSPTLTEEPKPLSEETAVPINETSDSASVNQLSVSLAPQNVTPGFFNFWNASTSLLSLGRQGTTPPSEVSLPTNDPPKDAPPSDTDTATTPQIASPQPDAPLPPPSALTQTALVHSLTSHRTYPLSTLLIVALISFLCGSLLRSLLSPADFIYYTPAAPTDDSSSPELSGGWREVKRLLELKYGLIGWDFVVAVVRRRPPDGQ